MAARSNPLTAGLLLQQEPMARHSSWRAGGLARAYYKPAGREDLINFVAALPRDEAVLWLGLGSNLLVRDGGFNGTVIDLSGVLTAHEQQDDGLIYAEAGLACNKLARFSAARGRVGAEFLAGIPGSLGGALAMNAGAFGGETWTAVQAVELLHRDGRVERMDANRFEVSYRSVKGQGEAAFLGAWWCFEAGDVNAAQARIKALLKQRNASQPAGLPSCGSVFRNPPGDFAARLIEDCGLKGMRIGGAQVSPKHANFIINSADATAADIEALMARMRAAVEAKHGLSLQAEVRVVGDPL